MRLVYGNQATESMSGVPPAEIVGRTVDEAFPRLAPHGLAAALYGVIAGQRSLDLGVVSYGDERVAESRFAASMHPLGPGWAAVVFDNVSVGAQPATEFAAVVESAQDAIVVVDLDRRVRGWNPAAERLFGYPAAEVMGVPSPIGSAAPEQSEELLARFRAGETVRDLAMTVQHRDGTPVHIEVTLSPLRDARGEVVGVVSISRDVGERLRTEARLRLLASIVESSEDAIVSQTADGIVTSWNSAAERVIGVPADEIVGRSLDDLLAELAPEIVDHVRERRRTGTFPPYEATVVRRDGRVVRLSVVTSLIAGDDGRSVAFSTVLRDVTAQRELEAQLTLSQKMSAVGQIAAGVAHDFNNLLVAVTGLSSLVLEELPEGSELHQDVATILAAGERGSAIVNRLLAFARPPDPERLAIASPAALLAGMRRLLEQSLRADIALTLETSSGANVLVQQTDFEQAMVNLVLNARDAIRGPGSVRIAVDEVVVGPEQAAGLGLVPERYVRVSVTDDGEGMDEDTRRLSVEPLFTTKEPGQGTGLGLAMVARLAASVGGALEVVSELGVGSTFSLYLPVVEADAGAGEPEGREGDVAGGSEAVLLVDDDAVALRFAVRALSRAGFGVVPVSDAESALAAVARPGVACAILDIVMPGTGGRELAAQLQAVRPGLPVGFVSGFAGDSGTGVLSKPYVAADLVRLVRSAIDGAAAR